MPNVAKKIPHNILGWENAGFPLYPYLASSSSTERGYSYSWKVASFLSQVDEGPGWMVRYREEWRDNFFMIFISIIKHKVEES